MIHPTNPSQKTAAPPRTTRPQENKNARIAQNELLDRLYAAFSRYRYWSLKALKAETRQPEAYLKETLLKIATLVKSGPFAMTYTLNPEAEMSTYRNIAEGQLLDEAAPDGGSGAGAEGEGGGADGGGVCGEDGMDEDDDDDDDDDMEDVL